MSPIKIMALTLSLVVTGCGLLQRHPDSGYSDRHSNDFNHNNQATQNWARRDLGLPDQSRLSPNDHQRLSLRQQLLNAEQGLRTDQERRQYYRYRGVMRDDRERLYFLSISTIQGREKFAQAKGWVQGTEPSEQIAELIEDKDIAVGMDKGSVIQSWGEPDLVEQSGNPIYGNERWTYRRFVGARGGFNRQVRWIYFESGRVIGWETL